MFRHKHKHPAFKALRDTVAFVVLCAALEWYVSHTDGAEAATAFRTVWPTLAVCCGSTRSSAKTRAVQMQPTKDSRQKSFSSFAFAGCRLTCKAMPKALKMADTRSGRAAPPAQ